MKYQKYIATLAATAALLVGCGGSDDTSATPAPETPATATPATPSSPVNTLAGTYTGNISKVSTGSTYSGPASMTLSRDVTGNFTLRGTWTVARTNSSGPQSITEEVITGNVTSVGALTATGSVNLRAVTGNVNLATGQITGSYTYAGVAGDFTGELSLTK
jgi:PBP1b-binding outer membrane lipoprotein LpoB